MGGPWFRRTAGEQDPVLAALRDLEGREEGSSESEPEVNVRNVSKAIQVSQKKDAVKKKRWGAQEFWPKYEAANMKHKNRKMATIIYMLADRWQIVILKTSETIIE